MYTIVLFHSSGTVSYKATKISSYGKSSIDFITNENRRVRSNCPYVIEDLEEPSNPFVDSRKK